MLFGVFWALSLLSLVLTVRAARAYGYGYLVAIVGGLLGLLGCLGTVFLGLFNIRVTASLTRAGVDVGLLGVSTEELHKLKLGVCTGCGYPITGLTTPICPECGTVIVQPNAALGSPSPLAK